MKRLIPLLFVLALCLSCKEDFIGQYPVDSIPPSKVLNAVVENYPGRVVITYDLPNDTLYKPSSLSLHRATRYESLIPQSRFRYQ